MRTFRLAAGTALMVAAGLAATGAAAQRMVAHGPAMGAHPAPPPPSQGWQHGGQWQQGAQYQQQAQYQHQAQYQSQRSVAIANSRSRTRVNVNVRAGAGHWGGRVGGRWWAGSRAPGGWGAYRRPVRGFILPSFWLSPDFFIGDYGDYGLSAPPYGYNWSRYYDDAVLTDGRGSVYDTVSGVDWDGAGAGYGDGYADDGYGDEAAGYDQPGAPYGYPGAGYAGGRMPPPGAGYAPPLPPAARYAPPPPPPAPMQVAPGRPVVVQAGGTYANGYYYPAPTVTTVTVTTTPVVTTSTEVFEDTVTYTRPVRRWHHVWHPRPTCTCR